MHSCIRGSHRAMFDDDDFNISLRMTRGTVTHTDTASLVYVNVLQVLKL